MNINTTKLDYIQAREERWEVLRTFLRHLNAPPTFVKPTEELVRSLQAKDAEDPAEELSRAAAVGDAEEFPEGCHDPIFSADETRRHAALGFVRGHHQGGIEFLKEQNREKVVAVQKLLLPRK